VTSSKDKTCRVWNVAKGECVAIGEGHTDAIGSICISHNPATYQSRKAFIISGAGDKILKRWSLPVHNFNVPKPSVLLHSSSSTASLTKLVASHSIRAHDKDINCVTVSPNDAIVASASQDKSIRLWNSDDLTPITTLNGHKRGVWKIFFSLYDKVLFSCSGDRTVKMWSMADYSILRTFEGNTASVLNGKLVNYGTQFITASADGLLRLYNTRSSECETTFDVHEDRVWALEYLTNSRKEKTNKKRKISEEEAGGRTYERAEVKEEENDNEESFVISGGSDSKLILWKDMTKEEELLNIQQKEETLLLEQQLYNDLRNKNFLKALQLALQLKHSQKVLQILHAVLENDEEKDSDDKEDEADEVKGQVSKRSEKINYQLLFDQNWSKKLDSYLLAVNENERKQLLVFLKEWNTNSRHCYLCQLCFNAFLRLFPMKKLLLINEFKEFLSGFHAYTERHYQRINRLLQSSYYISYLITSINGFLPLEIMDRLFQNNNNPVEAEEAVTELPEEHQQEEIMDVTYTITNEPSTATPSSIPAKEVEKKVSAEPSSGKVNKRRRKNST
jgi:U3 small nucleolar RNA-associated protein 13